MKRWHVAISVASTFVGLLVSAASACAEDERFDLRAGDIIAFVGGESVVRQGETGHLESLLAAANAGKGVRFRNLGWEGDTVFEQPRDLNFPGLAEQLKRAGATVVFAEFGRAEVLRGPGNLEAFIAAYEKLCDVLAAEQRRVVLVTPTPYGRPALAAVPDLSMHNGAIRTYACAIRQLANRRGFACADISGQLMSKGEERPLTTADGLTLSPKGCGFVALAVVQALGIKTASGELLPDGNWRASTLESVRQAVVEKNRLWFDYSRPMNWAFLGGDRQFVPSSRDPDDLKVRIFPRELERFVPLIERADEKVNERAKAAAAERK